MLDARRQNLFLSGAFFVASGATALAYEVIWFKRFGHVWGSSAHAWAAVVAAYLLGLGLGARFLGAWAARVRRPLFAYGVAELVVTVAALAIPFEIGWLASRAAAWTSLLGAAAWAQAAIRFGILQIDVVGNPRGRLLVAGARRDLHDTRHSFHELV